MCFNACLLRFYDAGFQCVSFETLRCGRLLSYGALDLVPELFMLLVNLELWDLISWIVYFTVCLSRLCISSGATRLLRPWSEGTKWTKYLRKIIDMILFQYHERISADKIRQRVSRRNFTKQDIFTHIYDILHIPWHKVPRWFVRVFNVFWARVKFGACKWAHIYPNTPESTQRNS